VGIHNWIRFRDYRHITKPWIGLAAGVTIGLAANLQDSNNARQNMVGGISGAVGGYLLIKTLKRDWHRKK
jgi:hypothetical protein